MKKDPKSYPAAKFLIAGKNLSYVCARNIYEKKLG